MRKPLFYSELAYLVAILLLALGNCCMTTANWGLSMVVAPAYLVHLKLSPLYPAMTFGVAEYLVQAVILLGLIIALRRFRPYFLCSFLSTLFYGRVLDALLPLFSGFQNLTVGIKLVLFSIGVLLCAIGVSFILHTYLPPEVYELVVKEISVKSQKPSGRIKAIYDGVSCCVAILLSFLFFGFGIFQGIKIGTLICALVTGPFVGAFNKKLNNWFQFSPAFPRLAQWLYPVEKPKIDG